jgi:hypothetical protein
MAALARVLVRRYGPRGSLWRERPDVPRTPIPSWQIWNEPNLGNYWCNRPNARACVRMLRVVGRAIKRVDRRAEIVTAGLPPSKLRSAVPLDRYLRRLYRAGGRRWFDTLAINWYAKNRRELGALLRSIRALMNRAGDRRPAHLAHRARLGRLGPRPPLHRRRHRAGRADQALIRLHSSPSRPTAPARRRLLLLAQLAAVPAALPRPVGAPHRAAGPQRQPQAGVPRVQAGRKGPSLMRVGRRSHRRWRGRACAPPAL